MAINFDSALGMREHAMRIRAERANVLSSNLANVDTPNFKARDIDFHNELNARMNTEMPSKVRATHANHVQMSEINDFTDSRLYRTPSQPSIDGNSVEEHVENAEFMKNNLEFQVAFTMLNSTFKGLKKAIRGE